MIATVGLLGGVISNATGHVGIVTGENLTTSAAADQIRTNSWGFDGKTNPTIRRCSCGG